ncbi:MAG: FAD-binding oxidoreductase [Actinomycetota bacterium]
MATREKGKLAVEDEQAMVSALRAALRGEVIDRAHPSYDEARAVWNGLIDRHPAAIARCADTTDVVEAVRVVREFRPMVSIRGGGHQVAGSAVCEDGLVIDLSAMRGVHVDPTARTARAQGGALWQELDRETQLHGLATTGGEVSITGVAGLTLGGGLGLTGRAFGLACDGLRSIEIVTADGMVRTASREDHPELLWAARGGGRGLGVVTSFEFDLKQLGPDVYNAMTIHAYEDAARVLREFSDLAPQMPETVTPEAFFVNIPPIPDFPEELHGHRVIIVGGIYAGPVDEAAPALAPLVAVGEPMADMSGPVPYVMLQMSFDDMFPDDGRYYMKSHFMDEMTDEAIAALLEWDRQREHVQALIALRTMGGVISRVGPDESAFAHRSAVFNLSMDTKWTDPSFDEEGIAWARSSWDALKPFANGGVYINFSGTADEAEELRGSVLGASEERLARIRRDYDPDGLFDTAAYAP